MKPCHVLNMLLTFWHLKSYVLIWFVLIEKNVYIQNNSNHIRLACESTKQGGYIMLYHLLCFTKNSVLICISHDNITTKDVSGNRVNKYNLVSFCSIFETELVWGET